MQRRGTRAVGRDEPAHLVDGLDGPSAERRARARAGTEGIQGWRARIPTIVLAVLAIVALAGIVDLAGSDRQASAGGVPPVQATYHGIKDYNTFSVGTLQYDAWTYGEIAFYSPPGMVTQDMANQWLAWYATTDDILRTLIGNDAVFESRYRGNDPNFGRVKVIGTPPDSCGAGCGNKQQAEGVGIIDQMVAEPDNFEHHWILFYEQARGGRDELFDLSATWPRESYVLPHLGAALTFYEIGGLDGLQRGVPGDIYRGLQKWEDLDRSYVDVFVEREQRWFDDRYPDGTIIFPPQASIFLHIAIDAGLDSLARVFEQLGHYPDNFQYPDSTSAMCDFQAAINDATGDRYAQRLIDGWGMPATCTYDMGQDASHGGHPDDLRFELNGLCADREYLPNTAQVGLFPCNGTPGQQLTVQDVGQDTFRLEFGGATGCLDATPPVVYVWSCVGSATVFQWNGAQLQHVSSGLCVTANADTRWGGGLLSMEACADSPAQRINTGLPPDDDPAPPPTTVPPTTLPPTTVPPTTQPPTTLPPTTQPTTTSPPSPGETPEGLFSLVNLGSGRCLDLPASDDNGANVVQWTCHGPLATNQVFTAGPGNGGFTLRFEYSGKCLDEWGGNIYQWECHGGDNQLFTWSGSQLQVKGSGLCVTVAEPAADNGANIAPEPCTDSPAQRFRVESHGAPPDDPTPSTTAPTPSTTAPSTTTTVVDPDPARVMGRVVQSDGLPASNLILDRFTERRATYLGSTATGPDGSFVFEVPSGSCGVLTYLAPDGQTFLVSGDQWLNQVYCAGPDVIVPDVQITPEGPLVSVGGTVSGAGPVPDVTATLYWALSDGSRGAWIRDTLTDVDGSYVFDLPTGCYVIDLVSPDERRWSETGSPWRQHLVCVESGSGPVTHLSGRLS